MFRRTRAVEAPLFALSRDRGVAYADVRVLEVRQFETALAVVGFIGFASAIIVGVSLSR